MSNVYGFERIDSENNVKCVCKYSSDRFYFSLRRYFTMIYTNYTEGSYTEAKIYPHGLSVDKADISDMLDMGIKVNLVVKDLASGNLILPLTCIDDSYAYFSNNSLTLMVDSNGAVTEEEHNA